MKKKDALILAATIKEIYASKNKKLIHLNLPADKPSPDRLAELLLGPTGNLRAPTLKAGSVLLVGFDEESYLEVLT